MKKKSASQTAFFNPRILIASVICVIGLSLALFAANPFGRSAPVAKAQQKAPGPINLQLLPAGFDCATVYEKGIDRQENLRAGLIMIACGLSPRHSDTSGGFFANGFSQWAKDLLPSPLFIGGPDVDVILPDGSFPKTVQSESMEWGGPNNTF